ncbi:terminase small subunit [Serratia marcescens]|uniref:terminase small subunit n=1 Tax=Serratia marcescens TaxID=615 RepID=UPI003204697A
MSKPDEKAIERDFCAGELSLQDVADKHGITIKALRYMAGKRGWKRNKGARAKAGQKNGAKNNSAPKKTPQKKQQDPDGFQQPRRKISNEENSSEDDFDLAFDPDEFGLSDQQALFVYWYVKTKNRVEAYRKAGYKCEGNAAYAAASRMYRNVKVSKAIRELSNRLRERYTADLDEIVDQLVAITRADPNALTQYRRVNCRHCWGENNLYQWRDIQEYDRAAAKAMKDGRSEPEYGGLGFVTNSDPNPDCPRCNGEGEGELLMGDTRDLDANEHAYFLGVKQTKNGIEAVTESKQAARAMLVKIIQGENAASRGGDKPPVNQYSPDDYRAAASSLDDEFGDLD